VEGSGDCPLAEDGEVPLFDTVDDDHVADTAGAGGTSTAIGATTETITASELDGSDDCIFAEDGEVPAFDAFDDDLASATVDAAAATGSGATSAITVGVTTQTVTASELDGASVQDGETLVVGDLNSQQRNDAPPPRRCQGHKGSISAVNDESASTTAVIAENAMAHNDVEKAGDATIQGEGMDMHVSKEGPNKERTTLSIGHGDSGGGRSDNEGGGRSEEDGQGECKGHSSGVATLTMEGPAIGTAAATDAAAAEVSSFAVGGSGNPFCAAIYPKEKLLKVEEALIENAKDVANTSPSCESNNRIRKLNAVAMLFDKQRRCF
jgi:hypothetical protein